MEITKYPSNNYFRPSQMKQSKIAAVCLHGTDGPAGASLNWLTNPKSDVSSNYLIDKAGKIFQLVDWLAGNRAWGNGRVDIYDNSIKWLDTAVKTKINPNWLTVSIEHEASLSEMQFHKSMTDAQFNSSIDLTAYILTTAGLKANHETIIAHCQICAIAKPYCPGVIFVPAYLQVLLTRYPNLK